MIGVVDGFLYQAEKVSIMERIDDVSPVFPGVHQAAQPELGKMLTDHRARDRCFPHKFRDSFWSLRELPKQVQACRFGQHPECARGTLKVLRPRDDQVEQRRLFRSVVGLVIRLVAWLAAQRCTPSQRTLRLP